MKNIHILPTDKPSILIIQNGNKLILGNEEYSIIENRQHIYITSDEEIKEGDWFIWKDTEEPYIFKCIGLTDTDSLQVENSLTRKIGTFHRNPKDSDYGDWYRCYSKKIVLTTYQELIKDGVQAIDDEFLKWFVENPSCDKVDVKLENYYASGALQPNLWQHKIIIPKEESKQEIMYSEEDMKNAFKVGFSIGYGSDTYATDEKNKTCEDWFKKIKK